MKNVSITYNNYKIDDITYEISKEYKKWSPILENYNMKDSDNIRILSVYLEYMNKYIQITNTKIVYKQYDITLPLIVKIFSKINLENKLIRLIDNKTIRFLKLDSLFDNDSDFKSFNKKHIIQCDNFLKKYDLIEFSIINNIITIINKYLSNKDILFIDENFLKFEQISIDIYNIELQFATYKLKTLI